MPKSRIYQRIGATAGILAPILALTCILTAVASYPTFSWTDNALSDLGVINGVTGPIFNFGLFSAGLLAFIFAAFGLLTCIGKSWAAKIGAIFFAATTIALMGIGVFNEDFPGTHYALSVAFFLLAPISLFIINFAFFLAQRKKMALLTVLAGFAAALPWLLLFEFNYVPNVAIPEFVSGVAVSAWVIGLSIKMLSLRSDPSKLTVANL